MIDYSDRSSLGIIFSWTGSTLSQTWIDCVLCMAVSGITLVVMEFTSFDENDWPQTLLHSKKSLLFPVAFLLVFRTGVSYKRFFEGRAHVGNMVRLCRDLARGISTYVTNQEDPLTQQKALNCVRLIKAYTIAVRLSCRKEEGDKHIQLQEFLTMGEYNNIKAVKKNFPVLILQWLGKAIAEFEGQLVFARAMDFMEKQVGELMAAWMGMQKLATTPFPFPYIQLLVTLLYVYVYTNAITLTLQYEYLGPPVSFLLCYALFGLHTIGSELEDPFGEEANDLDLNFFEAAANAGCKVLVGPPLAPEVLEPVGPSGSSPGSPGLSKREAAGAGLSPKSPAAGGGGGGIPDEAEMKNAIKMATGFPELSPPMQQLVKQFFDRYDLSGNGRLDTNKELTQLVTNLAFVLKMGNGLTDLLVEVEKVGDQLDWDCNQFTTWFLPRAQMVLMK